MSNSSDSEEFYDAIEDENQTCHSTRRPHKRLSNSSNRSKRSNSEPNVSNLKDTVKENPPQTDDVFVLPTNIPIPTSNRTKKFLELRQKLQNDDEDCASNVTPPNSQTSSVDGVSVASNKNTHPFKVIEHDALSLQSLGSLGRFGRNISSGYAETANLVDTKRKTMSVSALSSTSLDSGSTQSSNHCPSTVTLSAGTIDDDKPIRMPLQEPDVIASTKSSQKNAIANADAPVAPPRRKKQLKNALTTSLAIPKSASSTTFRSTDLASPASMIESLTREFEHSLERQPSCNSNTRHTKSKILHTTDSKSSTLRSGHSLDICQALKGQFVVKPQDNESIRAVYVSPSRTNVKLCENNSLNSDRGPQQFNEKEQLQQQAVKGGSPRDTGNRSSVGHYSLGPHRNPPNVLESIDESTNVSNFLVNITLKVLGRFDRSKYIKDLEILKSIIVHNLDTGERIPLSEAEERLPKCISPSALRQKMGTHQGGGKMSAKERRRSAGDENILNNVCLKVRTHTDSGKHLSDLEILEQVTVLNLDTGERIPLSVAEDKLPQCINPLSLHIMRLTSEYVSSSSMDKDKDTDEESVDNRKIDIPIVDDPDTELGRVRKKTAKIKRFVGSAMKKTMHKAKSIAQEVSHARHKEDTIDIVDNVHPGEQNCKLKAANSHKGPYEFEKVEHVQELVDGQHEGPIWCMKFSCCGRLLATAGQDKVLRIWVVRDAYPYFQDMRTKYNAEKVSPTPSQESLVSHHSADVTNMAAFEALTPDEASRLTFMPKPFCTYTGHTSDLLDVSWSKNYFILSSSMDKTVRLWHISRKECLCCFQHIDFVTAIVFHPRDDRYFLSGSLDGKLRLWNIPDKKVAVWNEVEGNPKLITAANFCQNGKFAVVGTYDGRCIFYITDQLKYHTQIHVRSSRGRNKVGRKISGIEPMPGEDKILVTSNDSRIRLYDLRDLNVSCKYKGYVNMSSQIKASFSHDGKYIVSGSENRDIYIWKTNHDYSKFSSVRRDRNDFWEAIKAHNAVVTCAIFAPNPEAIIKMLEQENQDRYQDSNKVEDPVVQQHTKGCGGYVLISADFNGCIKVFINKTKPKHSSLPVSAMA